MVLENNEFNNSVIAILKIDFFSEKNDRHHDLENHDNHLLSIKGDNFVQYCYSLKTKQITRLASFLLEISTLHKYHQGQLLKQI